ncbi:sugar ABC transporter substrate-binding protein [Saccharospirillum salsuginis]|uniref:Sugar ABC transporter substrate-binding protein n=1 Tax=Saccharospirillum salsuginis TaxID=418750 RepID=A0A918KL51_9GAMM|nr:sugar ABC transporter substrate-binding protein [Saccharospirillum salsuginis]GGX65069.1 sugar ABC transporter substrate-binding protein [Saccharospirillum salsuginis]
MKPTIRKLGTLITVSLMAIATAFVPAQAAAEEQDRFVLISHAPDSDSWWNTIKNAIREAGDAVDAEVQYRNPTNGDLADMARIVEQTVASNPDGIIVSIADYDVLKGPIEDAVRRGIPVITINSGTQEQSESLGALLHVGQPEYDAGYGAGLQAKKAGVSDFLCVNHYITNPASVERCQGFADALGVDLSGNMLDAGIDPSEVERRVEAFMRQHPDVDGILALGPNSAHPTLRYLERSRQAGDVFFATFDLSGQIAEAIKAGHIDFAIDQQPYLQGYMPVIMLSLYHRYGIIPANHLNSGPGFITADNIAQVESLAGEVR